MKSLVRKLASFASLVCLMSFVSLGFSGTAPWYQPPQLFVMTGFIANTTDGVWGADFIVEGEWTPQKQQAALEAWNKGLGREYDADKVVEKFKEAGVTGVIFYSKWHDGLVAYDTEFTDFKTERDLLGLTLSALDKYNMRKVVYYSVGLDYNPEPRFQEWTCLDREGRPLGLAFPSDWKSFHSPYRQFVIDQLVEMTQEYGPIDGLWLDLYTQPSPLNRRGGTRICHDRYTSETFASKQKKGIDQTSDREIEDFVLHSMREFLLDIRQAVSRVQPKSSFTFNGAGMNDIVRPWKARLLDAAVDWFSMEGHYWENIDRGARLGHSMDRPFEVGMLLNSSWYVPMSSQAPSPAMSENEAIVSAATAWIQKANVYAALTPGHSGVYDENGDLRLLRAIGRWLKENRKWLVDAVPYADVAIVVGDPSDRLLQIPLLAEVWKPSHRRRPPALDERPGVELGKVLRDLGYFTERIGGMFASRPLDLSSYRMLVLPETALLSSRTVEQIREYVRNGGKLLAFGHSSLWDPEGRKRPNFALSDIFGVDYLGPLPGYKQFDVVGGRGLISGLPFNPGALRVRATTGTVLAHWKSAGDFPAVVENDFGHGRLIYVSAEEIPFAQGAALLQELLARLIGPPPISVQATRDYSLLMNRKKRDRLLYLLNRSTGSRSAYRSGRAEALTPGVTGPERIRVSLNTAVLGQINGIELIPSGKRVPFSRHLGRVEFFLEASPAVTGLRLIE